MQKISLKEDLQQNTYPGRGIVLGKTPGRPQSGSRVLHHGPQ